MRTFSMRFLLGNACALLLAMVFAPSFIAPSEAGLNPDDYSYYFILNNQIRDVRDFSVVNDQILTNTENAVFLSEDKKSLMVGDEQKRLYSRYSLSGKLLHSFRLGGYQWISSDWTHKVYLKENDLWAADLDWKTGKEINHRQLTFLGTLGAFQFANWYKDWMLIFLEYKCYFLNTRDGTIKAMISNGSNCENKYEDISPDGRYIFYGDRIIDLGTGEIRQAYIERFGAKLHFWQQSDKAFVYYFNVSSSQTNSSYRCVLFDMQTGQEEEFKTFESSRETTNALPEWHQKELNQRSSSFSPSGRYLLYSQPIRHHRIVNGRLEGDQNTQTHHVEIGDLENKTTIRTKINFPLRRYYKFKDNFNFKWISEGHFIYSLQGDPLTQGTWVYDIHKQTQKKVTPYIADQYVVLAEAKKVVFIANNHIFRVDADGTNVKQLTEQSLNRWNQKLKTFLEK